MSRNMTTRCLIPEVFFIPDQCGLQRRIDTYEISLGELCCDDDHEVESSEPAASSKRKLQLGGLVHRWLRCTGARKQPRGFVLGCTCDCG